MEPSTFVCTHCGETHPSSSRQMVQNDPLCPVCMNTETLICSRCGETIYRDDNGGDESIPLCRPCYDRYYTRCEWCGRVIYTSDAYYEDDDEDSPLCYDCHYRINSQKSIRDYYYKPEPLFRGDGHRYFGVELEIDEGGERNDRAAAIMEIANENGVENIYCKHDGSLEDGIELVTHPCTLDYHRAEMPWSAVLEKAKSFGYLSHQASTCGLHVHINRNTYGHTEAEQEDCIARILYLFERFWEELLIFSRRTPSQLERWAARYGYDEQPQDILKKAKGTRNSRYAAVNLTNAHTIEFRMFRGTLKLNTLIATLELLDRVSDVAIYLSDEQIKALSWTTFVSGIQEKTYPALVQYLKERRLYVNEIVEDREEEI